MVKVLQVMGPYEKDELLFLNSDLQRSYIMSLQNGVSKTPISKVFKYCSKDLQRILQKMLHIDPSKRITPKEALKDPMFNSVRDAELETSSSFKVRVPIEEEGMFDYAEFKNHSLSL